MKKHIILFVAAGSTRADREARAIRGELECGKDRDCFELETRWAIEPLDLLRELRRLKPTVVHFSGCARIASTAAVAEVFGAAGASVGLIVLSACYTEAQAEALLAHVDCVVGTSESIDDDAARSFAIGFYGGLADREPIASAFTQGLAAISLQGPGDGERPRLGVRAGIDAGELVLIAGSGDAARPAGADRPLAGGPAPRLVHRACRRRGAPRSVALRRTGPDPRRRSGEARRPGARGRGDPDRGDPDQG